MKANPIYTRLALNSRKGLSPVQCIVLGILLMAVAAPFVAVPMIEQYPHLTWIEQSILWLGWGTLILIPAGTTFYAATLTARDAGSDAYGLVKMTDPIKRDIVKAYYSVVGLRLRMLYIVPFSLAPLVIAAMIHFMSLQVIITSARYGTMVVGNTLIPELVGGLCLQIIILLIVSNFIGAALGVHMGLRLRDPLYAGLAAGSLMLIPIATIVGLLFVILITQPQIIVFVGLPACLVLGIALWRIPFNLTGHILRRAEQWI